MAEWLTLFDTALDIIANAEKNIGSSIAWTIDGETNLYDMFAHRHSRDIDIFVSDPQIFLFLTPRSNEVAEQVGNAGSYVESSNFIKFVTQDREIDFIVAPHLTTPYAIPPDIGGPRAMVETPVEILPKRFCILPSPLLLGISSTWHSWPKMVRRPI